MNTENPRVILIVRSELLVPASSPDDSPGIVAAKTVVILAFLAFLTHPIWLNCLSF
jgi:hypothetical protein